MRPSFWKKGFQDWKKFRFNFATLQKSRLTFFSSLFGAHSITRKEISIFKVPNIESNRSQKLLGGLLYWIKLSTILKVDCINFKNL